MSITSKEHAKSRTYGGRQTEPALQNQTSGDELVVDADHSSIVSAPLADREPGESASARAAPNSSAAREALGLDQKTMDEAWASACRQIRSAGEDVVTLIRRAAQNIEAATPDGCPAEDPNDPSVIELRALRQLAKYADEWRDAKESLAVGPGWKWDAEKKLATAVDAWRTAMRVIASPRSKP